MLLKKSIVWLACLGTLCLPFAAKAELVTQNLTDRYSVYMIMSSNLCSGTFNDKSITPPGTSHSLDTLSVRKLCAFKQPCEAYLILSTDHDHASRCSGKTIAGIEIHDLKTDHLKINVVYVEDYHFSVIDNKLTIGPPIIQPVLDKIAGPTSSTP